MKKVVGIGACVLDTVISLDDFPKEDVKKKAEDIFSTGGGPVANALVAVSKLGLKSEYLGVLSDDANGKKLYDEFVEFGVKADKVKFISQAKAFTSYVLLSKSTGSRTCIFDRGTLPDDFSNVDRESLLSADLLHLDGNCINSAIRSARLAKEHGIKISIDAGGMYDGVEELLSLSDVIIPSEEFALKFTKKDNAIDAVFALYEKFKPEVLVVTQGAKGGIYYENGEVKSYKGFEVKCVDSNGAGDTFHGAFISAYLEGKSVGECCRFASAVSAIKCSAVGVRKAIPDKKTTLEFIKNNK